MDGKEYAKSRLKLLQDCAGEPLTPVAKANDFLGRWEMRWGGPAVIAGVVSPKKVQWIYDFAADGTYTIGKEKFVWRLQREAGESFLVFAPSGPGGELYGERKLAFKMSQVKLMLSSEDTSVVEILTKVTAKEAKLKRRK